MAVWTYSGAHKDYPVKAGETWTCGNHTLVCGDLEGETPLWQKLKTMTPDLVYVDPPWNSGNARSFRTKAGVDGESGRTVDLSNLLKVVLTPSATSKILTFIETGKKEQNIVKGIIAEMGGTVGATWNITYYRKNPCILIAADFRPTPFDDYPEFEGLDDEDTPDVAIEHYKPSLVLDPCGGRGGTATAAEIVGVASLTNELSPYRMAEALKKLHVATGIAPTRVD